VKLDGLTIGKRRGIAGLIATRISTPSMRSSPRERGQNREAAMREYLTWEINLVNDMAKDDDHRFRVTT
jgi:hypothetical protein